jgi:hypothetical protein
MAIKSLEQFKSEIISVHNSASESSTTDIVQKVIVALEEVKSTVVAAIQSNDSKAVETISTSNDALMASLKELQKVS